MYRKQHAPEYSANEVKSPLTLKSLKIILTILAIGRIVGETAALIYTAGTVAEVSKGLLSSGRTLAIHMYVLSSEGLYTNQAYATAVVLLIFVLIINFMSSLVAKKFAAKN